MNKPRIGITMRLEAETCRFYLGRDYSEALYGLGAIPVHLSLIPEKDYIFDCLQNLDGILLPGSDTDVDPFRYGEEPHRKLKRSFYLKDQTDYLVLEQAENLNLPVLAICYGMQALNVYRGGTLFQDIETQVENSIRHEQGIPLNQNSHSLNIDDKSLISRLITSKNNTVRVNSHHHQAIKNVGVNLRTTAWANDGVVECIEDIREGRFNLGVQWHPELSWQSDELSRKIFETLIEECR